MQQPRECCMQRCLPAPRLACATAPAAALVQARQLFKAGIRSPENIVDKSPEELAVILQGVWYSLNPKP